VAATDEAMRVRGRDGRKAWLCSHSGVAQGGGVAPRSSRRGPAPLPLPLPSLPAHVSARQPAPAAAARPDPAPFAPEQPQTQRRGQYGPAGGHQASGAAEGWVAATWRGPGASAEALWRVARSAVANHSACLLLRRMPWGKATLQQRTGCWGSSRCAVAEKPQNRPRPACSLPSFGLACGSTRTIVNP
jgi:hypothetical protein